jgi:hypothetical protein
LLQVVCCRLLSSQTTNHKQQTTNNDRKRDSIKRNAPFVESLELHHHLKQPPDRRETGDQALAGGYIRGATPVPIPNTAVKPAEPMILPQRESRSPPALNKSPDPPTKDRGFLLRGRPLVRVVWQCAGLCKNPFLVLLRLSRRASHLIAGRWCCALPTTRVLKDLPASCGHSIRVLQPGGAWQYTTRRSARTFEKH